MNYPSEGKTKKKGGILQRKGGRASRKDKSQISILWQMQNQDNSPTPLDVIWTEGRLGGGV